MFVSLILLSSPVFSEEPNLPAGLSEGGSENKPDIDTSQKSVKAHSDAVIGALGIHGFWEGRMGRRLNKASHQSDTSISETRLQLEGEHEWKGVLVQVVSDFLYDPVADNHELDLEEGYGWWDLRKVNLFFRPAPFMDMKLGRQILTWGTGDLVFINDLFPKDWKSFFIGRDEEYLKAPSDAVKTSFFLPHVNMDVVYTPRFDADRFIEGERLSYYHENRQSIVGQNALVETNKPDDWFSDEEWAARLHRLFGSVEAAAYYYNGYWKSPAGQNPQTGMAVFPSLIVTGFSLRGPLWSGVAHAEIGQYESQDDSSGNNPYIRNSEWRCLTGFEKDLGRDFIGALQWYTENIKDYEGYKRGIAQGLPRKDEHRHVFTQRLTKLLLNQNLVLSVFNFYSPTDDDGYLRPKASYKFTDQWQGEIGGNIFYGAHLHTFFGQFEDNNNLFVSIRYGF